MAVPGPTQPDRMYPVLLQVSKAANSELEFAGVLQALAKALLPIIPVDVLAVVTVEGGAVRSHAVHVGDGQAPGEPVEGAGGGGLRRALPQGPARLFPLAGSGVEAVGRTGRALVCEDIEAERAFPEDDRLLSFGLRSYVRSPLIVHERLIGTLAFCYFAPRRFSPEEVGLMEDLSAVIATAVSNSLAFAEISELRDQLRAENLLLKEEIDQEAMFEEIVGSSASLRRVLAAIERVAPTDASVLISGETGTGKELVARAIHRRSPRGQRAMIKVNCAALPETLIGSELFGHEKGAFTGALQRRIGRFEMAHRGSIFLDEIGELPPDMQAALLRILQDGEFERVGGSQTLHTDARVIAATNRDLGAAVAAGRFRSDLFYRLNVFPIEVPPLRLRRGDIPLLVNYFVARFSSRLGKKVSRIEKRTLDLLVSYSWPGNVREMQNLLERAMILCDGSVLRVEPEMLGSAARTPPRRQAPSSGDPFRETERELIESALAESLGRVSGPVGAAARLGVPASTLESKIRRLQIDKYRFRPRP